MTAELLAGARPASVWDAVDAAGQGAYGVLALALVVSLLLWPVVVLARRRRTRDRTARGRPTW